MIREQLIERVASVKTTTHNALQAIIDELNKGQVKKLVKNENIKALLDRYSVNYSKWGN